MKNNKLIICLSVVFCILFSSITVQASSSIQLQHGTCSSYTMWQSGSRSFTLPSGHHDMYLTIYSDQPLDVRFYDGNNQCVWSEYRAIQNSRRLYIGSNVQHITVNKSAYGWGTGSFSIGIDTE